MELIIAAAPIFRLSGNLVPIVHICQTHWHRPNDPARGVVLVGISLVSCQDAAADSANRCDVAGGLDRGQMKLWVYTLVPMDDTSKGLTDKLYWRRARGEWHCFKKLAQVRGFISLCQRQEISSVRGQKISRPEAALRCGLCDGLEMERRGWQGSGPISPRRAGSGRRARTPLQ
jgi:hypothetical protein